MSYAVICGRAAVGIEAPEVQIEVHLANGLPALSIVGLPEAAVKESKDRVRGALLNSRFDFPARRITINLAPADLPKEGSRFDLPIALGILAASNQIPQQQLDKYEFLGEVALSGELRPIRGVLAASLEAKRQNRTLILPSGNAAEATLVEGAEVIAADHLLEVCAHLAGQERLPLSTPVSADNVQLTPQPDLSEVHGQHQARRALEIAAAGNHSLLYFGPPGTGKTMLASRLPGILPPLSDEEAVQSAAIRSLTEQGVDPATWRRRPFRAPHHTASAVALVGGGSHPRPGEISLAHNGVLFLDELPEYDRKVLEVLREPLESGQITISRAARQASFPARFQLIAAMNPCPCGYYGHENGRCRCTPDQIQRYRARLSGPLLDRIDLQLAVPALPREAYRNKGSEESSAEVRRRVTDARERQLQRQGKVNSQLNNQELERHCPLQEAQHQLLDQAIERLGLSARAYHRILKVARTIADLAGNDQIDTAHLSEAFAYRQLDKPIIQ